MYKIGLDKITINTYDIPIADSVDVLVCGGGVAGIAAAVSAARAGARTLLIERAGFLGGTATGSAMGLIVIPAKELTGFPREFFSALAKEHGAGLGAVVPWDIEAYKLIATDFVLNAGAQLLLYTWCSDVIIEEDKIKGIIIDNKSGRQAILAKIVIDATGDGDILAKSGAKYQKGRESDGAMRPLTVMGRFGYVNSEKLKAFVNENPNDFSQDDGRRVIDLENGIIRIDGFFSIIEKAKQEGVIDRDMAINYIRFSGINRPIHNSNAILICNSTRIYGVDGTNASEVTSAEIQGRKQLKQIFQACKKYIPGFENSELIDTSSFIGVRETRRLIGKSVLTYDDISTGRKFSDSIALLTSVNYGTAEVHGPDHGHEGSASDSWAREMKLDLIRFEFPLRSILSEHVRNLLVVGRCISVTHDVDKFVRNMAPTGLIGESSGLISAFLCQKDELDWNSLPTIEIRNFLKKRGVIFDLEDKSVYFS